MQNNILDLVLGGICSERDEGKDAYGRAVSAGR